MDRSPSALPIGLTLTTEPYDREGASWVHALSSSTGWERVFGGPDGGPLPPGHIWFGKVLGPVP